jgi:hypothetical protein
MAINNFGYNLQVFAKMVMELYERLRELDDAAATRLNRSPMWRKISELNETKSNLME